MSQNPQPDESLPSSEDDSRKDELSAPPLKEQPLTWVMVAARYGVSVQSIKAWRQREGAPITTDRDEWDAFVKKHELGKGIREGSLRDEKTRWEIEILKAKEAREKRRVIDRNEVNQLLLHISTRSRTMLYQFLETELAPKLDGMSAVQMRPILREVADSIADAQADLIAQFERQ